MTNNIEQNKNVDYVKGYNDAIKKIALFFWKQDCPECPFIDGCHVKGDEACIKRLIYCLKESIKAVGN